MLRCVALVFVLRPRTLTARSRSVLGCFAWDWELRDARRAVGRGFWIDRLQIIDRKISFHTRLSFNASIWPRRGVGSILTG